MPGGPLSEVNQRMKFRHSGAESVKIETQMAPMIDVVFLLLIFFMLTLKVIEPEGDFNINMPLGSPAPSDPDDPKLPDIKVRLIANEDGSLRQLLLGERSLGNGASAFDELNRRIGSLISGSSGSPFSEDIEVEIDADFNLNYEHTVRAFSACTGRIDEATGQLIRYIEKIKLAPPKERQGT